MTPTISNPPALGSIVGDIAAIKVVTDALPDAGALDSVKARVAVSPGSDLAPTTGNGATIISDGTADTYGAWVELVASMGADSVVTAVTVRPLTTADRTVIDIGIGSGGSEVSAGEHVPPEDGSNNQFRIELPHNGLAVANGGRVSVRSRDSSIASNSTIWLEHKPVSRLAAFDA